MDHEFQPVLTGLIQLHLSDFVIFDPASYYFVSFDSSNLFRVFGCAPGSTEATTLEASKNPMR